MARYGKRRSRSRKARTARSSGSNRWGNRRSRSVAPKRGRVSRPRRAGRSGTQRIQIELIQPGVAPVENMVRQMFSKRQLAADKGGSTPPPRTKSAF